MSTDLGLSETQATGLDRCEGKERIASSSSVCVNRGGLDSLRDEYDL